MIINYLETTETLFWKNHGITSQFGPSLLFL